MEKNNIKLVFMGTPDFAVPSLKSLYEAGYSIERVISQKDQRRGRGKKLQYTPVKEAALELGLEVYQPENINDDRSVDLLREIDPDFIVVVAYGQILRKDILEIPKYGCYNIHASLLPKYRGAAPINWVLIDGEEETGVTIMEMEEGLDTGDMILRKAIPIEDDYTTHDIHDSLASLGARSIVEALDKVYRGEAKRTPQDHEKSSYASMLDKEMGLIDWNKNGRDIINLIRGLMPWPSAYSMYGDQMVKIHRASLAERDEKAKNGEIFKITKDAIYVGAEDSAVRIEELQFPGKRKMSTEDYLKGNTIELGTLLK